MFATSPRKHARLARLHRQRGASLLEAIAYLGVAAMVVLAAVSLLQNAFGGARSNQTLEELTGLRTNVRKMYAGQSYADDKMQANLVTAKAIPTTLRITGTDTVANTWGGATTVEKVDASSFKITYTLVPQDVCVNVVSGATGWTKIADGTGAHPITAFPAPAADAAALCVGDTNTVVFTAN